MKNGYKVTWTDAALSDLSNVLSYLSENWTEREIANFSKKLHKRLATISQFPISFPKSRNKPNVRRSVLSKNNIIYYSIKDDKIVILRLVSPRQLINKM